jgi:hypothetical protein
VVWNARHGWRGPRDLPEGLKLTIDVMIARSLLSTRHCLRLGIGNGCARKGKQRPCRVSGVRRKRTLVSRFATRSDRDGVKPRTGKVGGSGGGACFGCAESFARDKARKRCVSFWLQGKQLQRFRMGGFVPRPYRVK